MLGRVSYGYDGPEPEVDFGLKQQNGKILWSWLTQEAALHARDAHSPKSTVVRRVRECVITDVQEENTITAP